MITNFNTIPNLPGVYIMRDAKNTIVYIGKAKNLNNRIKSYFYGEKGGNRIINIMFYNVKEIDYVVCGSEQEALLLEQKLIHAIKPLYNVSWKDDKSYPFLEITLEDNFPKINFIRKIISVSDNEKIVKENKNNRYFGPYPSAQKLKYFILWLSKFFRLRLCKYDSAKFPGRTKEEQFLYESCIYNQTNQCFAPCLNKISKKEYDKIIKNVVLFLRGKWKRLLSKLNKQMQEYSKNNDYEKAIVLRDIIKHFYSMRERFIVKETNEKKLINSTINIIEKLKGIKKKFDLKETPVIMDAVDVSNFSGDYAVGSVVRFVNGVPDKKSYRKFKIKTVFGQNDFNMMQEIVLRRYFRLMVEKQQLPHLLLIDGGRGHLNVVYKIIKKLNLSEKIDLLSIAKKNDEIYCLDKNTPVKLDNSEQDNILRFLRDEAHRFAISYNRKIRKKNLFV